LSRITALVRPVSGAGSPSRPVALTLTERLSAVTHLVSSLEYLARSDDREQGGLNDWTVMRGAHLAEPRWALRIHDAVGDDRVTNALHVARVAAAVALIAGPEARRPRLAANSFLAASSVLLQRRQRYGADGSDQVGLLVQTAAAVARAGQRRPETVDACLWFIALQSVLSYTASGWAKLAGSAWRSGEALTGIMRTQAYGDRRTWQVLRRYPRTARWVGGGVLALECLFPVVFAGRGRMARPMVAAAAGFHLANGRLMGLGRFVWSFISMHPALLYAAGRPGPAQDGGTEPPRSDLLPRAAAGLGAGMLAAGMVTQAARRRAVMRVRAGERTFRASSGNVLAYRHRAAADAGSGPVVILEAGLMGGPDWLEWLTRELSGRWPVVTYWRAGYGPSRYTAAGDYDLEVNVQDLADLARHVGAGRPVVLAGHSLGGYLCYLAAGLLRDQVRAVCLLDSSHPAELLRSARQARGADDLEVTLRLVATSLRLGWGGLLKPPGWLDMIPAEVRADVVTAYQDARQWEAACREWRGARRHFDQSGGAVPELDVPLLVITAGQTAVADPVHQELQDEFAGRASRAESHVLAGVTHERMLVDAAVARRVAGLIGGFLAGSPAGDAMASATGRGERP
jgi:pimeloyl-ACP methyl ester carboxylesterase